jgi:predicted ATPase
VHVDDSTCADASSHDVAITLLGGFAIAIHGEPLTDVHWRLRKARDLVKLLALAPAHRLHREQLMEALWADRDPAAAANNLNQVVHAARRVLGAAAIELRDELLTLHATVDVDDFERAADHAIGTGSPGAHGAALALYGGELLPEDRYEDWTIERRERLEQLRAELESSSAGAYSARHLRRLPEPSSSFIGREHELHELTALARDTRLLTLAGAGGCGKTRLALELARRSEERYEGGVAFVELAGVDDEAQIAATVASALDIAALPGRSALQTVIDYVAPRALLLVLDNCEHILPGTAALCDALLRAAPGVRLLATTREPLRVAGEVVFRVPSLAIPRPERVSAPAELLRYEAVALFAERAAAAVPGFVLDEENAPDVARICFRLDGLPLAIELAAARLGGLGTSTLADRLDDRFTLLRGGMRTAPSRQQTLLATLEWSHELLAEDERVLLRRLAVFVGGFDLDAAETVCADAELEADTVVDVLARLVEKSLVVASGAGRELRYRLLETVRLYGAERLEAAGEAPELSRRHALWALALAERHGDNPRLDVDASNLRAAHEALSPHERLGYCVALLPFWMRRIDLEEAHRRLTEALAAAPARTELRAEALIAASAIDYRAGALACGASHVEESDQLAQRIGAPRLRWRALQRLGEYAVAWDDSDLAAERFERARALAGREGFAAAEALSIYSIGVARWLSRDLTGTEELLMESLAALRSASAEEPIASPLNIAEVHPGDGVAPLHLRIVFEETLQPFYEISRDAAIGYVLANQATIARLRGEPDRARRLLEEAAAHFARIGDARGEAAVLVRVGHLMLGLDRPDAARRAFEEALRMRRAMADRRGVGIALSGLALAGILSGDHALAARQLEEARELFRGAGDRWGLVSTLWRTADLAVRRGDLEDARAALDDAAAVAGETGRKKWIAVTVAMQAQVAGLSGEYERADTLATEAARDGFAVAPGDGPESVDGHVQSRAAGVQSRRKSASRTNGAANTRTRSKT